MTTSKTHWRKIDYREESLNQIVTGLDNSIISLRNRLGEVEWYDGLCFYEDLEPIFGLAFVSFQNYINGSISDLYGNVNDKSKLYKIENTSSSFERSRVELIIGLANYIKHKDEGTLHKGTRDILEAFDLKNYEEISESPIFNGLTILSETWNIFDVLKIVTNWRKSLFVEFEKHSL